MAICGVAFAANSELSTNEIEFIDRVDTSLEHLYESRLEGSKFLPTKDFNLLLNLPRATQDTLDHAYKLGQRERYQMKARKKALALTILEDLSRDERAALDSYLWVSPKLSLKIVQNSTSRLHKSAEANMIYFFEVLLGALGTSEERVHFQFIFPCEHFYEIKLVASAPVFEGKKTIEFQSCASGFPVVYSEFRFLLNSAKKQLSLSFNNYSASYLVQFQDNQPTPMTADPLQDTKPLQIKATFQDFGAALDYRAVNLTDATAETVFRLMASSLGRKVKYVGVKPSQARATYTFDAIPLRALGVLASGVSGQVTCRVGQNVLAVFRRGDVRARDRKLCYL